MAAKDVVEINGDRNLDLATVGLAVLRIDQGELAFFHVDVGVGVVATGEQAETVFVSIDEFHFWAGDIQHAVDERGVERVDRFGQLAGRNADGLVEVEDADSGHFRLDRLHVLTTSSSHHRDVLSKRLRVAMGLWFAAASLVVVPGRGVIGFRIEAQPDAVCCDGDPGHHLNVVADRFPLPVVEPVHTARFTVFEEFLARLDHQEVVGERRPADCRQFLDGRRHLGVGESGGMNEGLVTTQPLVEQAEHDAVKRLALHDLGVSTDVGHFAKAQFPTVDDELASGSGKSHPGWRGGGGGQDRQGACQQQETAEKACHGGTPLLPGGQGLQLGPGVPFSGSGLAVFG